MRLIDDLFGMGGGYVLDFSDRTFAAFFSEELSINIDESRYAGEGTSKAKRLRVLSQDVQSSHESSHAVGALGVPRSESTKKPC